MRSAFRWALVLALALGVLVPSDVEAQAPVRPVLVYLNRDGDDTYHVKGCSQLQDGAAPVTLQNAKNQGYKPCPVCKPPE